MTPRLLFAALALAAATPAHAGGSCAGECYVRAWQPAEYGAVAETYPARAPRTYAIVSPPVYRTVTETVVTRPAGRLWQESRDAWGRRVGCWIDVPARTEAVSRRVMVSPGSVEPYAVPMVTGVRLSTVETRPAGYGWAPVR